MDLAGAASVHPGQTSNPLRRYGPLETRRLVVRRPDQTFVAEPVGVMARRSNVVQQFAGRFSSSLNLTRA